MDENDRFVMTAYVFVLNRAKYVLSAVTTPVNCPENDQLLLYEWTWTVMMTGYSIWQSDWHVYAFLCQFSVGVYIGFL